MMTRTRQISRFVGVLISTVILFGGFALADTLYGISSSFPTTTLYTIDKNTGQATAVVNISGAQWNEWADLASYNGLLYATDMIVNNQATFGSINPTTGAYTVINDQGGGNWSSLAFNPGNGLFYTVDIDQHAIGAPLLTVSPTGTITTIGPTNQYIVGLAFVNGVLYGVGPFDLYIIDPTTGATTSVGQLGLGGGFLKDIAFDPVDGKLYLNKGVAGSMAWVDTHGSLYTVDMSTGDSTLVGDNGPTLGLGIVGLAYMESPNAVPEPSSLLLLSTGLMGLAGAVRRRLLT